MPEVTPNRVVPKDAYEFSCQIWSEGVGTEETGANIWRIGATKPPPLALGSLGWSIKSSDCVSESLSINEEPLKSRSLEP